MILLKKDQYYYIRLNYKNSIHKYFNYFRSNNFILNFNNFNLIDNHPNHAITSNIKFLNSFMMFIFISNDYFNKLIIFKSFIIEISIFDNFLIQLFIPNSFLDENLNSKLDYFIIEAQYPFIIILLFF